MYHNKKLEICMNCNSKNHDFNNCLQSITSWGIILVKKNDKGKIELLLISRKHSIGYVEFMRGNYKTNMMESVINLIKQMMLEEIIKIKENLNNFNVLWDEFKTGKEPKDSNYKMISEKKFLKIKFFLKDLLDKINPTYSISEYGFPKGRKMKKENELECACREFTEETGISFKDIILKKEMSPIIENFIGTNGKKYKHVYFLAEYIGNINYFDKEFISQSNEIGDINFYDKMTCMKLIRPYHKDRLEIINKIFSIYEK